MNTPTVCRIMEIRSQLFCEDRKTWNGKIAYCWQACESLSPQHRRGLRSTYLLPAKCGRLTSHRETGASVPLTRLGCIRPRNHSEVNVDVYSYGSKRGLVKLSFQEMSLGEYNRWTEPCEVFHTWTLSLLTELQFRLELVIWEKP